MKVRALGAQAAPAEKQTRRGREVEVATVVAAKHSAATMPPFAGIEFARQQ